MSANELFLKGKDFVEHVAREIFGVEKPIPVEPPADPGFIGQLWGMKDKSHHLFNSFIPSNITDTVTAQIIKHTSSDNANALCNIIPTALFIVVPVILIICGSILSVDNIPSTALPPTDAHPDYDPLDNNICCDIAIIRETPPGPWYSRFLKAFTEDASSDSGEGFFLMMPVMATISLVMMYYLFKVGLLRTITDMMHYGLLMTTFFSVCQLVISGGQWFILLLAVVKRTSSKSMLKKYRLTFSDDDTNDDVRDGGKYAVSVFAIQNFNYVSGTSEDRSQDILPMQKDIDDLNKPKMRAVKRSFFRELAHPKDVVSKKQLYNLYFNWLSVLGYAAALAVCYTFTRHSTNWIVCNLVSMCVAITYISMLRLPNLRVGVFLLSALFFYDVFFVFATPIMVTVATNMDLPAVIRFPNGTRTVNDSTTFKFSLIGLGDIILPGIFISMCHRFDVWRTHLVEEETEFHLRKLPHYIGRYFISSLAAYIAALICCSAAMHYFRAAQPALLYISPALILTCVAVAHCSGDLAHLWTLQYDAITVPADSDSPEATDKAADKPADTATLDYNSDEDADYTQESDNDNDNDSEGEDEEASTSL